MMKAHFLFLFRCRFRQSVRCVIFGSLMQFQYSCSDCIFCIISAVSARPQVHMPVRVSQAYSFFILILLFLSYYFIPIPSFHSNSKEIPFVALAGENEMAQGKLTLKNMTTGEQTLVSPEELIAQVK